MADDGWETIPSNKKETTKSSIAKPKGQSRSKQSAGARAESAPTQTSTSVQTRSTDVSAIIPPARWRVAAAALANGSAPAPAQSMVEQAERPPSPLEAVSQELSSQQQSTTCKLPTAAKVLRYTHACDGLRRTARLLLTVPDH